MFVSVRLQLVEPRLHRDNRLWSKPEHPRAGVLGWAFVSHDACLEQHAQVSAHRRCRCARCRRQLAGAPWADTQQLYDLLTGWVGQRAKQQGDVTIRHADNSCLIVELLSSAHTRGVDAGLWLRPWLLGPWHEIARTQALATRHVA